jgi:hypothetical protein
MRVYISGKISDLDWNEVKRKFSQASAYLKQKGYQVENPVKYASPSMTWEECMKIDIAILVNCDAIALLPYWINSRGARLECKIAKSLGLKIIKLPPCFNQKRLIENESAIFMAIEAVFKCSKDEISSKCRKKPLPDARRIFIKIAREQLNLNDSAIGQLINIDRTTAVAAYKKANVFMLTDKYFRERHKEIEDIFKQKKRMPA